MQLGVHITICIVWVQGYSIPYMAGTNSNLIDTFCYEVGMAESV